MTKLNTQPRIAADPSLVRELREHAQQVNSLTEGRLAAYYNAQTAAPTTGTHAKGDIVRNTAPADSGTAGNKYALYGWLCVVGGTPGTWVECRFMTDDVSGGGGGSVTEGTAALDFGASPGTSEASVVVTGQTSIALTSNVRAFILGGSTSTDHTASDHRYAAALVGLTTGAIVAGTGFTIYGRCLDKMEGDFTINWEWT